MSRRGGDARADVQWNLGTVETARGEATWRYAAAGAIPQVVARPRSIEQVVEAVRLVRERKGGLIACGKGERLAIGARPRRYDVALAMGEIRAVQSHRAEDMTVTVEAGMSLTSLDRELAKNDQCLPFDPAAAELTTVGGLIAADAAGPLRHRHGKVRDYLLGVELVSGAGQVVRAGGKVVKNVAGYDVSKLVVGSFGTLGVIVSATFKTRPRPRSRAVYVWECGDVGEAIGRAVGLDRGTCVPAFLEALNEAACEAVSLEGTAALLIGLQGSAAEVEDQAKRLFAATAGATRRWPPHTEEGALQAMRNFALPIHEDALVAKAAVPPTLLADLMVRLEGEAKSRGAVVEISAHAAIGVARCQILAAARTEQVQLIAEWLRLAARQRGGAVVYEAIPDPLCGKIDPWGFAGRAVRLMRGVKSAFDPDGIMSPGRFVGGI